MTFIINSNDPVTRTEFDRLYDEAFSYLSVERQRLGENMKETLWNGFNKEEVTVRRYELDGYLVGCSAIIPLEIEWQGNVETWMWYYQPTYGQTTSGSRSWWYSEEFQKVGREWADTMGYDKVMALHNPTSPAALAVANTWGSSWDGRQYFESPEVHTLEEIFGEGRSAMVLPDTMRVFLIDKH
jgi:hypothetical protein